MLLQMGAVEQRYHTAQEMLDKTSVTVARTGSRWRGRRARPVGWRR